MNTKIVGESEISDQVEEAQEQLNNNLVVFPKRIPSSIPEVLIDEQTFLKIKKQLTCPICLEIFVDPVYVKTCSHRFCKRCIERCLRSNTKQKQCPACRQAISTKRTLKEDQNVSNISQSIYFVQKIFTDVNAYKLKENEIEDKQLEELYHFKIEIPNAQIKRGNSKRQENNVILKKVHKNQEDQQSALTNNNIIEPLPHEIKSLEKVIEMMQQIIKEYKIDSSREDLVEIIHLLLNDNIQIPMDWILSVRFLTKPDDFLTKQIEPELIRTSTKTEFKQIKEFLCLKLNLNKEKYCQRFKLWRKINEVFALINQVQKELIQQSDDQTLATLYNKFCVSDLKCYDKLDFLKEIIDSSLIPQLQPFELEKRTIYYSFDFEDFM